MIDFRLLEEKRIDNIYQSTLKRFRDAAPKMSSDHKFLFPELYSYQVLDNFRLDVHLSQFDLINMKKDSVIEIPIRNRNVRENSYEIKDSAFPIYAGGYIKEGIRRSRYSVIDRYNFNVTEVLELRIADMIPGIIYLLEKETFDQDEFNKSYDENELKDFNELLQCLTSKTINTEERSRLLDYLKRDDIINRFIWKIGSSAKYSADYYHHPSFVGDYFKSSIIYISGILDIILAYAKNYMLPIQMLYLDELHTYVNTKPLLKVYPRSVQDYRIIIERDIGSEFDFNIKFNNESVLKPGVRYISDYRRILDRPNFNLDEYLEELANHTSINTIEQLERDLAYPGIMDPVK